jgi:hypothetical protein
MKNILFMLLSLLMVLAVQLNAFADEKKDKAIADFNNITVPNILAMAPFISKSAEERMVAFSDLQEKYDNCSKAGFSGFNGGEMVASKVGSLCLALVSWLKNNDARTCNSLKGNDATEAFKGKVDSKIKKAYQKANITQIYNDLEIAAGCKTKDKAYWSKQALNDYFEMADKLQFDDKGNVTLPEAQITAKRSHCFFANALGEKYSKVSDAAYEGCMAIGALLQPKGPNYCYTWLFAREAILATTKDDVFSDRTVDLTLSLFLLTNRTGCEAKVKEALAIKARAAQDTANAEKLKAILDPLYNVYNNARAAADEEMKWVDIWAVKFGDPDRIANTCRHYELARNHVVKAQHAAAEIYGRVRSDANKSRFEAEQRNMKFLNTQVTGWCK